MYMRYILLLLLSTLIFQPKVNARILGPEATVSILTCNPGTEVYSMYGHTAIRVSDPAIALDAVFNYGVFSFNSPNFIYRFAKGQTDYLLIGEKFKGFLEGYLHDQRSVYEQVLNLSAEGKSKLFEALLENAKPENREYRYNFFMDNCATRVRDMIERNGGGTVHFKDHRPEKTYRDLIKEFHHSFRWIDLGIDLLVAKKADQPVSAYGQMFLPDYLMDQFAKAEITIDGDTQPLVLETLTLAEFPNPKLKADLPWPAIVFGFLFLLIAAISVRATLRKSNNDWIDYWLMGLTGFAGFIIGWFTLFSEHPAMSPNYNLLWAFPGNLFFAFLWKNRKWRDKSRYYFWLAGALLLLSLLMGQVYNPAVYFIMLILMVRVVVNLVPERKR